MICSSGSENGEDNDAATINSSFHYSINMDGSTSQTGIHNYQQEQLSAVQLSSWQGQQQGSTANSDTHDFMHVHISKPSPNGSTSSYFCRICHEGDVGESLVAPCKCTGTVALIHTSCLEHWLTSSNSDRCEICKFSYKIIREPRSCNDYLHDPANQFNVRNLIADIICFFLLTPLLIVSTYLCALGANQYFIRERWEAVGLVVLSLFLLAVYFTWCHVTTRFHISMWKSWQHTNQQIRLVDVHESHCGNNNSQQRSRTPLRSPNIFSAINNNSLSQSRRLPFSAPAPPFIPLDEDLMDDSDTSRIIMV